MKKTILLQLLVFGGFWLFFWSFQNPAIYHHSLGVVSDNWRNDQGQRLLVDTPFGKLTNENFIYWDAVHYHLIKNHGYDVEKAGGDYIFAFFPFFPLLWKVTQLPPVGVLFLNYLFLSVALLILLKTLAPPNSYLLNGIFCLSLPSIAIFFIPYTEATYLLTASIGIYGWVKKRYWIFFVGFLMASMTRPSYTFLLLAIVSTEFFFWLDHKQLQKALKNTFKHIAPLLTGAAVVSLIQYMEGSGNLFKFIAVQKYWKNILAVPHNLRDWSHEGFAMNVGVIFILFIPLFILIFQLIHKQVYKAQRTYGWQYSSWKDYFMILSIIFIIGNGLFIVLFRGGSLHSLFRFTLCSPFFYVLLLIAFNYIRAIPVNYRFFFLGTFAAVSIFVLGLADYSTYWQFPDFGLFVLIGVFFFWFFQNYREYLSYKVGLVTLLIVNLIWTSYMFNTYIMNGWLFA